MNRRFQFSLLLMVLATVSCSPPSRAPGTYVYRLDGEYYEKHGYKAEPPSNNLHRWPVLERKVVTDEMLANELLAALDDQWDPEHVPGCFYPGFGVAIDDGEHSTEAVICLMCDYIMVYKDGALSKEQCLTDRGHKKFADLYSKSFP